MGVKYCTTEQLYGSDEATGYLDLKSPEATQEADNMLEFVSRLIDFYISGDSSSELFKPAPDEPTELKLRGNGLSALPLPTHIANSITNVAVNAAYRMPAFSVENGMLIQVDSYNNQIRRSVWREGLQFIITARWGYETTPEPIQMACMAWTAEWLRDDGGVFTGTYGDMQFSKLLYKKDLPPQVKIILDEYKRQFQRSQRAQKGFIY